MNLNVVSHLCVHCPPRLTGAVALITAQSQAAAYLWQVLQAWLLHLHLETWLPSDSLWSSWALPPPRPNLCQPINFYPTLLSVIVAQAMCL